MKAISLSTKKTLLLYSSSLFNIILGVGTSVLNTHSLSPIDYGDYRYITNIINFISSLLLFGFFVSGCRLLAIAKDKTESRRINGTLLFILCIAIILCMLFTFLSFIVHKYVLNKLDISSLFLFILPFCYGPLLQNYINTVFQGESRIGLLSIARFLPSLIYIILAYIIYTNFGATTKRMLLLFNGIIVFVSLVLIILTRPSFKNFKSTFSSLIEENKRYGLNVYIGSILSVSLGYISGIILGNINDNNISVGFFTLALTIASPLAMLPTVIGTANYKSFASMNYIPNAILKNSVILSVGSYILFSILIYPAVHLLYGESYLQIVGYSIALGLATTIHGYGDLLNRFLGAHGCGRQLRNGALVYGIILVLGNFTLVFLFNVWGAVLSRILSSLGYLVSMIYYYKNR